MASPLPFQIEPLPATFGAVVTGARVAELDEAGFEALYAAWLDYALLILPGQHLTKSEQVAFARRFGPPEFELAAISNVRADGSVRPPEGDDDVLKILKGNMGWHQDSTYMPVQAKGAVFSCEVAPRTGGETGFADMRAAWDALDAATQARLEGLSARHSLAYTQGKLGHVHSGGSAYSGYGFHDGEAPLRPLVKVHPETGRKSLAIGRHAFGVTGMAEGESERFLEGLVEAACQPPRVWTHAWTPGDVVVWDNRCLLHRAMAWDLREPRVMWHSRIAGNLATEGV
ncbi:TauD/TfdA family dioxygenase [Phenylobacterium sp.]|jgi:alpha-ketoglutarate-dependent taurine dioxygenase|uniref:TauD/TfdA dioxygenase family protein n=1 Tax=Phenylobacterium sp. TaxID=1871053 RepID=UPI002F9236D3